MFPTILIINNNKTIELIKNILKSNIRFYSITLSINFYNNGVCRVVCTKLALDNEHDLNRTTLLNKDRCVVNNVI